jgi:hypothetical protein
VHCSEYKEGTKVQTLEGSSAPRLPGSNPSRGKAAGFVTLKKPERHNGRKAVRFSLL